VRFRILQWLNFVNFSIEWGLSDLNFPILVISGKGDGEYGVRKAKPKNSHHEDYEDHQGIIRKPHRAKQIFDFSDDNDFAR